jgi:hypothetical protein
VWHAYAVTVEGGGANSSSNPFATSALEEGAWPRPGRCTPGIVPETLLEEAGWALGQFWMARKISPPPQFGPQTIQPVAIYYTVYAIPAAKMAKICDIVLHLKLYIYTTLPQFNNCWVLAVY